jgi:hypothetical protein
MQLTRSHAINIIIAINMPDLLGLIIMALHRGGKYKQEKAVVN